MSLDMQYEFYHEWYELWLPCTVREAERFREHGFKVRPRED